MMTPTRIPSAIAAHVDMSTTMPQFRISAWFRHAAGTGAASGVLAVGRTTVTPRGKITRPTSRCRPDASARRQPHRPWPQPRRNGWHRQSEY
jgi:hypothetical protein